MVPTLFSWLSGSWRSEEPEAVQSIPSSLTTTQNGASEDTLWSDRLLRGDLLMPKPEDPWARKNVLCLDGGGIRGYASLLIIRGLMEKIAILENHGEDGALSHTNSAVYDRCMSFERDWDGKYWPHHYFDYFVGTSTGGLSAIMLGRMQLTVDEALKLYDRIGDEVFAHPRLGWLPRCLKEFAKMIRARYDAGKLEKALQDAIHDHLKAEIQRTNVSGSSEVPLRNENPDAAQTVVVTWGGSKTQETCLFRSFDHPPPGPNTPYEDHYEHIKPYSASLVPLWAAARATSAAPTYFKRIKIGDAKFWDGAVGPGCNNPVQLAYNEVTQMHRNDKPAMILSVGTGTSPKKNEKMSKHPFKELFQLLKKSRRKASSSVDTYNQCKKYILEVNRNVEEEAKIHCVRLNPDKISDVKLDTWRPLRSKKETTSGADTKALMQESVRRYLSESDVDTTLEHMAESLVKRRRGRAAAADCGRWERFALHLYYGCPEQACSKKPQEPEEPLFKTRDELCDHAFYRHGIVQQIDTRHCSKDDDRAYICRWDGCGQKFVPVFASEIDLKDHLQRYHKLESPRIMRQDEYEDWLDEGREKGANRSRSNSQETICQHCQGVE